MLLALENPGKTILPCMCRDQEKMTRPKCLGWMESLFCVPGWGHDIHALDNSALILQL